MSSANCRLVRMMVLSKDVHTKMRFVKPDSKDNRRYITPGLEINTGFYEEKEVLVRDARPQKEEFTLESTGFQLFDHHTEVNTPFLHCLLSSRFQCLMIVHRLREPRKSLLNLRQRIETFLLRVPGCDKVLTYDPYIRHS